MFALLDQDDVWYPHHLETLIKPFRETRYPELGWVYSNLDEIDRDGLMVARCCLDGSPDVEHPKRSLYGCLATDMFVLPTSSLINRRAFEAVGGFDEQLIGYEDDDLFLRIFRRGFDNVYLNDALSKWRIFPGSTSHSHRMGRSRMLYLRKLLEAFPPSQYQGADYARDPVAPRFFPALLVEYRRSAERGDRAAIRAAVDDISVLVPLLPLRYRMVMQVLLPFMTHKTPATIAARISRWSPPLTRRLRPGSTMTTSSRAKTSPCLRDVKPSIRVGTRGVSG